MGTVLFLLAVPLLLFLIGELQARFSWTLFGFSVHRVRTARPARSATPRGRISRQPDLPPRLSLHERSRHRIVYHETGEDGEPPRGLLRA